MATISAAKTFIVQAATDDLGAIVEPVDATQAGEIVFENVGAFRSNTTFCASLGWIGEVIGPGDHESSGVMGGNTVTAYPATGASR